MKPGKLLFAFALLCLQAIQPCEAQTWNPAYAITPAGSVYNVVCNGVPPQLIELYAAAVPNTGLAYQWEKNDYPTGIFTAIPGATQSNYTPPAPFIKTAYYKRKTTNTVNGQFIYSNTVKLTMVSANWEDLNYVREHDVNVTGITTWQQVDAMPIGQKLQTTTYLDGLGRSLEKVSRETATPSNAGSLWGDVVQYSVYDNYGREAEKRLPYTTTTQSGKFKTSPKTEQEQYYSTVYNETAPHSSLAFEESPLARVLNVKEPGYSWHNGNGKSVAYDVNTAADDVKEFSASYVQGSAPILNFVYPNYDAAYPNSTLYKSTYTDEAGKKVVEFRTKAGQVILKKVELEDAHPTAYTGWICTYFVYDDFGQLRFQLQPEAVNYLANNGWSFGGATGQQVLNEWCFQYFYDEKGRTVWKKAPGGEPLVMLYDVRDRLVFTQDGAQRVKSTPEWTATLYDVLDRPVISTLYQTAKTTAQLQTDIANASNASLSVANPATALVDLMVDTRDQSVSRYAAQASIEFNADFESAPADEFVAEIDPAATANSSVALTPYLNPISSADLNNAAVCTVLKYQFYDNYSFTNAKPFSTAFTNTTAYNTGDPNVQPIALSKRTLSFPTGNRVRVLGTNTFLGSTSYYDERGSLIQTLSDNLKSGSDVTTLQYHFDGRVLSSCSNHSTAGTGYAAFKTLTKYLFDKLGRVTSVQKGFGTAPLKTISSYDYDDVGRVKTKHLDPDYLSPTGGAGGGLESLTYSFNIHNQLTGINKDYALKAPATYNKWGHFFGLYLGYDNRDGVFNNPNLNGQVTGLLWNTQGDDVQRRYDYTYDNAGRLTAADFKEQQHPGDGWAAAKMDFSVSGAGGKIKYDLNGNLLEMLQKGVMPGGAAPLTVDDLRYEYYDHSNKLKAVTDAMTNTSVNGAFGDFKDGTNTGSSPDYVYDANGNLVIDLNKNVKDLANVAGANGIHYNYLDKPDQIRIAGKGTINIVYSAGGEKLQRTFTPENGTPTTTTYINQFVYQASGNGPAALSYINFEEGRIRVMSQTAQDNGYDRLTVDGNIDLPNGKRGVYDYYVLDYQQNVRMILTEETHFVSNTATMETSRASVEEPVFGQTGGGNEVAATRYPSGSTGWQSGDIGSSVSRVAGYAHPVGPNTLQKVMAGDVVSANVQYYYNAQPSGNANILPAVVGSLLQALGGSATTSVVHQSATNITSQLSNSIPFQTAVQPSNPNGSQTPQAYLTLLFFDERFNLVDAQDGGVVQQQVASSVTSNGSNLPLLNIKAPKNGYVYAYVSNQSNTDVYFDNLAVSIAQGHILEENHYYAFGLKIQGISSKRMPDVYDGKTENKYGMQGAFAELDDDIGWHDFTLRNYDAQTGRWVQLDPYADNYLMSPYAGMGNDPVNMIDPSGGSLFDGLSQVAKSGVSALGGAILGAAADALSGGDGWKGAMYGALGGLAGANLNLLSTTSHVLQIANQACNVLTTGIAAQQAGNVINADKTGNGNTTQGGQPRTSFTVTAGGIGKDPNKDYKPIGRIDVSIWQPRIEPLNVRGLYIELLYKDLNSNYTDFRWIQTVRTSAPLGNAKSPYNDPQPPDDDRVFYHTDDEPGANSAPGYNARFKDGPNRDKPATWMGELSLVAQDKNRPKTPLSLGNNYVLLITFTYGFKIDSGMNVTLIPLTVATPSSFQLQTILNAR